MTFSPLWLPFRTAQTALQQPHPEAALREQERRRGAAPPALAISHIFLRAVEHGEHVAHLGERNVDRSRQLVVLVFRGIAHIEPERASSPSWMTTSPRAALMCWKRLSSSSMCAAGSCANAPPRRFPRENAPVIIARAMGELSLSVPAAAT